MGVSLFHYCRHSKKWGCVLWGSNESVCVYGCLVNRLWQRVSYILKPLNGEGEYTMTWLELSMHSLWQWLNFDPGRSPPMCFRGPWPRLRWRTCGLPGWPSPVENSCLKYSLLRNDKREWPCYFKLLRSRVWLISQSPVTSIQGRCHTVSWNGFGIVSYLFVSPFSQF